MTLQPTRERGSEHSRGSRDACPYVIERRGTDFAPWTVVHRASGVTMPVLRPYPGPDSFLPPIYVANHRSRADAERAAGEVDWTAVNRIAASPEGRAVARRAKEKREFDAAYSLALERARAGEEPWPWEPGGFLHREPDAPEPPTQLDLGLAA